MAKVMKTGKMKPVRGGSGHMFGETQAEPMNPGTTSVPHAAGAGAKFAAGGKTKMFGFTGSSPAKPK